MDRPKRRGKLGVRPTHGPIVQAVLDAQEAYRDMRKSGADPVEVEKQIAAGLKAVLGRGVHQPRCAKCEDTGWVSIMVDVRHVYGPDAPLKEAKEKCTICGYWERRWEQYCEDMRMNPNMQHDEFTAAARTSKRGRR